MIILTDSRFTFLSRHSGKVHIGDDKSNMTLCGSHLASMLMPDASRTEVEHFVCRRCIRSLHTFTSGWTREVAE